MDRGDTSASTGEDGRSGSSWCPVCCVEAGVAAFSHTAAGGASISYMCTRSREAADHVTLWRSFPLFFSWGGGVTSEVVAVAVRTGRFAGRDVACNTGCGGSVNLTWAWLWDATPVSRVPRVACARVGEDADDSLRSRRDNSSDGAEDDEAEEVEEAASDEEEDTEERRVPWSWCGLRCSEFRRCFRLRFQAWLPLRCCG